MAEPFPVRWSYEAWQGAYGEPWQPHWRPWPWEDEERERIIEEKLNAPWIPQPIRDSWQAIKEAR